MDWGSNHSDAVIVLLYKPCFCWLIKVNDHTYIGVTSLQLFRNPRQQFSLFYLFAESFFSSIYFNNIIDFISLLTSTFFHLFLINKNNRTNMSGVPEASNYILSMMTECILFCFQNKNLASACVEFMIILLIVMAQKLVHVHL